MVRSEKVKEDAVLDIAGPDEQELLWNSRYEV